MADPAEARRGRRNTGAAADLFHGPRRRFAVESGAGSSSCRRHYREPKSSANRTARYKRPDPGDTRTDTNSRGGRADPH